MNPEGDMMTTKPAQDQYQVRDQVQSEIVNRFEALTGGLSSLVDWAVNTKHLNTDDVNTLEEMRHTLAAMNESFNERTMKDMAEPGDIPTLTLPGQPTGS